MPYRRSRFYLLFLNSFALLFLFTFALCGMKVSAQTTTQAGMLALDTATPTPTPTPVLWTPEGGTWSTTVTFVNGLQAGLSETSLMIFAADGSMTATFPDSGTSATNGGWQLISGTNINLFNYHFEENIVVNGQTVAHIHVHIYADLTSATTYVAGGIGIGYSAATGAVIPGQYSVSETLATRTS